MDAGDNVLPISCTNPKCEKYILSIVRKKNDSYLYKDKDIPIEYDENGNFITCPNCGHKERINRNRAE